MDEYQWLLMAQLIERYDSLQTALQLLAKLYPDNQRISELQKGLMEGRELKEILGKGRLEKKLRFYVQYVSLAQAIRILYQYEHLKNDLQKKFVSQLAYQLLLFVIAMIILTVFNSYVLPNMISILEISGQRSEMIVTLFKVADGLKNFLLITVAILCLSGFYIISRHRQNYLWVFLHSLKADGVIRLAATYQFSSQLEILLRSGLALKPALEILRFNSTDSFVSQLAYHFDEELMAGRQLLQSVKNEWFDVQFYPVCAFSLENDDFPKALADYRQIVEKHLERFLKRLSLAVSAICYSFVTVIIVLAYQVLLLPMELLEGL